jgi:hypothetical protein
LKGDQGSYSATSNNCGDPVESCLSKIGINAGALGQTFAAGAAVGVAGSATEEAVRAALEANNDCPCQ